MHDIYSMTRCKVKVTSASKLEILPFYGGIGRGMQSLPSLTAFFHLDCYAFGT